MTRSSKNRNHFAIEKTPRRFTVHAQHRFTGITWSRIDVSNAQHSCIRSRDIGVHRDVGPIRYVGESRIGCSQDVHKVTPYMKLVEGGDTNLSTHPSS